MEKTFSPLFLISQEETEDDTAKDPASVAPVINARNHDPEQEESDYPSCNLLKHGLSVYATPTFSVIENRADQTAYTGRCPDGERDAGQIGHPKSNDAAKSVQDDHSAKTVFSQYQGAQLP